MSRVVEWVEFVWLDSGRVERLDNKACEFRYRDSVFKRVYQNRVIVTRVAFRLARSTAVALTYRDLVERLGTAAAPEVARQQVLAIRREKGMTLDHGFGFRSAGSFFMNPVVSKAKYLELLARVDGDIPSPSQSDGSQKLAGAWLIEKAGFARAPELVVLASLRGMRFLLLTLVMAVAMNCSALPSKFNKVCGTSLGFG